MVEKLMRECDWVEEPEEPDLFTVHTRWGPESKVLELKPNHVLVSPRNTDSRGPHNTYVEYGKKTTLERCNDVDPTGAEWVIKRLGPVSTFGGATWSQTWFSFLPLEKMDGDTMVATGYFGAPTHANGTLIPFP